MRAHGIKITDLEKHSNVTQMITVSSVILEMEKLKGKGYTHGPTEKCMMVSGAEGSSTEKGFGEGYTMTHT